MTSTIIVADHVLLPVGATRRDNPVSRALEIGILLLQGRHRFGDFFLRVGHNPTTIEVKRLDRNCVRKGNATSRRVR